jgi:enoyl-CoA hydratase
VESTLRSTKLDNIVLLQLENAAGYPRLERRLLAEIGEAILRMESRADVRGIVITGSSQAFAVGADLGEVGTLDAIGALRFSELGQSLMRRIERCARPVIAAVRGYCLGGGFDLAIACHARIAAEDAVFGHPGGSLGLVTGWGGTVRLPRLIGLGRAREMLVTGRTVTAAEAFAARLVSRVVPADKAMSAAMAFVGRCRREKS